MMEDSTARSPIRNTWQPVRYEEKCRRRLSEFDRAVAELIDLCPRLPGIRQVYAFGSYARRSVGPASDLDLLVVRETLLPRVERERDIRLALQAPVALDVLVVTPDEYRTRLPSTSFGRYILDQAVLLADYTATATSPAGEA